MMRKQNTHSWRHLANNHRTNRGGLSQSAPSRALPSAGPSACRLLPSALRAQRWETKWERRPVSIEPRGVPEVARGHFFARVKLFCAGYRGPRATARVKTNALPLVLPLTHLLKGLTHSITVLPPIPALFVTHPPFHRQSSLIFQKIPLDILHIGQRCTTRNAAHIQSSPLSNVIF
jgi:hypothetical protein